MSANAGRSTRPVDPGSFAAKFRHLRATHLRLATDSEHRDDVRRTGDPSMERQYHEMTIKEIAFHVGLTPTAVGYLLDGSRGDPHRSTMQRIADFYGRPVGLLASNAPLHTDATLHAMADRVNGLITSIRPGTGDVEYTNAQLAAIADCTEDEICGLRDGSADISLVSVQKLAEAFGVNVGYIVDGDDAQRIEPRLDLLRELSEAGAITQALDSLQLPLVDRARALAELTETLLRIATVDEASR